MMLNFAILVTPWQVITPVRTVWISAVSGVTQPTAAVGTG